VMIFDTWGGSLSQQAFHDFSLTYIQHILAGLKREHDGARIPSVVFVKGGGVWLEALADTGCDALGIDWTLDIGAARRRVGNRVALQGNLDPMVLLSSPDAIVREARAILDAHGPGPGHIFNLGHGISQFTPPDHVAVLVETVHQHSKDQRRNQRQF
jgi:uroporphyrinogen decarboxylase